MALPRYKRTTFYMKLLVFLTAFLLIHFTSYCQTPEQLDSQVVVLYQNDKFEEGIPLAEKAIEIININGGDKHPGYVNAIEHLGILYKKIKNYEKAKIPYQLLSINKKLNYGEFAEEYALSLNQLAILYDMLQQNDSAITLYKKAIQIFNTLNQTSENYYTVVENLAGVYKRTGDYENAISYYKLISQNNIKLYGDTSRDYALSQNEIGLLYSNLKKYDSAIKTFKQSLSIYEKADTNSTNYLIILQNLATTYKENGNFDTAVQLFTQLTEKGKRKYGEGKEYAALLNQMGFLYIDNKKYAQALFFYSKALGVYSNTAGENDATYLKYASDVSLVHHWLGEYDKAENLLLKILDKTKSLLGENLEYAATANSLAQIYVLNSEFQKGEFYYLKVKEIRKTLLGENTIEYASIINNLGGLYYRTGKYTEAEKNFKQAIEICEKLKAYTRDYAEFSQNLAALYEVLDQHNNAEDLYLKSLAIMKNLLGEEHPGYLNTLTNLADVYRRMGQYKKAEDFFLQIIASRKKVLGDNHPDYAESLADLASVYEDIGSYKKAEFFYRQSMDITKLTIGETHVDYAGILKNLGSFYNKTGQYSKAEAMLIKAAEIYKQKFGINNDQYGISLSALASLYENLGQRDKAEKLYLEVLGIYKSVFGEEHTNFATALNNLALIYENAGEFKAAERLHNRALEIKKKLLGEAHPSYLLGLGNLATLYESMGQITKAETLLIKVVEERKKLLGDDHIDYALSLGYLGLLYAHSGKYEKAEPLLLKSLSIRKEQLGNASEDYAHTLRYVGGLYMNMKQFAKAEPLLLSSVKIDFANLFSAFTILSEKDKENFIKKNYYTSEQLNSFLAANPASTELAKNNYNTQLILKSLSLADTRNMIGAIQNSKDLITQNLFTAWQNNKALLSKQYALPLDKRISALDSIENATENLEKELNKKSLAFRNQSALQNTTFIDVRNKLHDDEAAIEFVKFNYYTNHWTDTIFYAAYLLRKNDSVPKFISLCEEKQLEQLFANVGKTTTASVGAFYRGVGDENENISVTKGDSLYRLIWQPLEPYLNGINKVSYSPAGKLYTIAFNALPVGDKKVLMDKYELQQYTSTREIALRNNEKESTPKSIALFGDATFTLDSLQLVKNGKVSSVISTNTYLPSTRGSNSATWGTLPGTAEEVKKIQQLFIQNKIQTKAFTQTKASEEGLKLLSGSSPEVLHIATHGFFLPEPDEKHTDVKNANTYSLANDPLLRSGLILSGGNYAWSGKTPINGVEDGIATAYEISQLDLSKTELVVLSACETALGDIKGSEGVFGLQRSFKMAGVKKLIVSLWQVPDKETAELMTLFYADWLKGNTIENAFYKAQSEMRKKYSPFYWAAFVLVE